MKLAPRCLLLTALLAGCAGRISSSPGVVRTDEGNPIVTVGAGEATISGMGTAWRVWYVIDRASQTCWMKLGDSAGSMDCCKLLRVESARAYVTWENASTCAVAPAPTPAPAP